MICAGCGDILGGAYIEANGKKYHENCFVCTGCNEPFDGGYVMFGGCPYHRECAVKAQRSGAPAKKAPSRSNSRRSKPKKPSGRAKSKFCVNCGANLGGGPFCVECGTKN